MTFHRLVITECLLLLGLGLVGAAQDVEIKKVPMKSVSASSGKGMYVNYCAVCHGMDGKGVGPAAKALKTPPPDLTVLAKKNGGTFPESHVYSVIVGDANMPASHGEKDMPVWAALFRESCGGVPAESEVHQRVGNLTKYVGSLQQK